MRFSLRLAVAFFVLSTLPVGIVSYVSTRSAEQAIEEELTNHLAVVTAIQARDLDRWVHSLERMIENIAQRPLVVDLTTAVLAQSEQLAAPDVTLSAELINVHLLPHLRVEGLYEAFAVVDANTGRVVASTEPDQVGTFRIGEAYFERGLEMTIVDSVKYTPSLERLALHVAAPIAREAASVTAVLVGRVDLSVIDEIVSSAAESHETEDVYLVNRHGFFVTEPQFGEGYALRRATYSEGVQRALAGETGVAWYTDYRGARVLGAFRWLPDREMALIAEIDEAEAFAPIQRIRMVWQVAVLGAIVGFSGLGMAVAWRLTDPFRKILAGAARIGEGEFTHRIGLRQRDEVGDLAKAFDRMAENLQEITASRDDLNREIAGRREAEIQLQETVRALQASEAQFRLLSEGSPVGVFIVKEMVFRYANPALESIFGYRPDELLAGLGPLELTPEDDHRDVIEFIQGTLEDPEMRPPLRFRGARKDGSSVPCEVLARPIEYEGEPAILGTVMDTTLRDEAEQARQMADDIVRSIPSGLFIYRVQSADRLLLVDANPEAERLIGVCLKDLRGRDFDEMWPGEAGRVLKAGCQESVASGEPYRAENLAYSDDRIEGHYRIHAFPIPDSRIVVTFDDVSQRQRAEERFRLAADVASDLIYEWDVESDELRWFGDIDEALGYERGEIPSTIQGWVDLIHPEDQARLSDAVERHRVETQPIHEVYRVRGKSGEWRHWIDRGVPIFLGSERPRRWIGVCIDDTERIEAYRALAESEGRFRRILENAPDVIYRYRLVPEPEFEFISPAVYTIAGYTPAEYYADPRLGLKISHPEDRHLLEQTLQGKPLPGTYDMRWIHKDGHVVWVEDQHVPIRGEDETVIAIEGVARDVTEYKHAQEALLVSEAQHRSLFENAALGIYQTTSDGRILAANPALVRMLGYESFEELAERNLEQEGYEPEHPRSQFKDRIEREGRIDGREAVWIRKDGKRVILRESAVAVRNDAGNTLFYEGTIEDITAQREAEDKQQELEAQLRQTQKLESIGTLASGVAHEINNPLTGIINYAELISSRVDDARLKGFADSIMSEGERVAEIVRNLLSFARREKESCSPARLADILSAAMSLVGEMLAKDRIQVEIDLPENLPKLRCRSQQIQQVLLNLLTNARDALNDRYPESDADKRIRITARTAPSDGETVVRTIIEDYGTGISEETIDRIFDPFFTTKPRERGTGLGLSVSYGIVREHHGRMSVESERGAYTRVILDLPIAGEESFTDNDRGRDEDG